VEIGLDSELVSTIIVSSTVVADKGGNILVEGGEKSEDDVEPVFGVEVGGVFAVGVLGTK